MQIEIRTPKGKKLFEWNPETNAIIIVLKKQCYHVEFWNESNYQALCKRYHDKKTWTEDSNPDYYNN